MTSCEQRGYKVGDLFRLDVSCLPEAEVGDILKLIQEDGTLYPRFRVTISALTGVEGREGYFNLCMMTKLEGQ